MRVRWRRKHVIVELEEFMSNMLHDLTCTNSIGAMCYATKILMKVQVGLNLM